MGYLLLVLQWLGVIFLVLPLGVVGFWYTFCQAFCLQNLFRKVGLPIHFRIHRATGLEPEEEIVHVYPVSARDPYRLNVDVNIDGVITRYHGRY